MEINNIERRLYKNFRNTHPSSSQTSQSLYGSNFEAVEQAYIDIYEAYLNNLLVNLITYKNAPITFDGRFCEWCLRQFGFCRVGGIDKENIFVLEDNGAQNKLPGLGMFGYLVDQAQIANPFKKGETLCQITRFNVNDAKDGFVTLANKYNYYFGGFGSTFSDVQLVHRTALTLAHIKATELFNIDQMKIPFIGFSKNKNLTAANVWEGINAGLPFVNVDEDAGDLNNIIKMADLNIPNFLPDLKDQWNNELSEMLTMLGINNVGVDKKERLVKSEVDANSQLIEASGNIYLDARNEQLALINHVFGTNIKAEFNQEAYTELVQLMTDTRTDIHQIEDEEDKVGDHQAKQIVNKGGNQNG